MQIRRYTLLRHWFVPLALFLFAGCGPYIKYTSITITPLDEKPDSTPVRVYRTNTPRCQYEKIGIVRASNGVLFGGVGTYVDAMKKKARQVGGDAILLGMVEPLPEIYVEILGDETDTSGMYLQTGVIIRFLDRECVE